MRVHFKNSAGLLREVKVGFSWTSFFFGPLPFFFRGIPLQGLAWIVAALLTCGLTNIYLWFTINKKTAQHYLENGYRPVGEGWEVAAPRWGVAMGQQSVEA